MSIFAFLHEVFNLKVSKNLELKFPLKPTGNGPPGIDYGGRAGPLQGRAGEAGPHPRAERHSGTSGGSGRYGRGGERCRCGDFDAGDCPKCRK